MSVRPITAYDWRSYKNLRLRALQESPDAFGSTYAHESTRDDPAWKERVATVTSVSSAQAFLGIHKEVVHGLIWCKASDADHELVEIFQMWVAPEARGLGIGRALLETAVAWAENRGAVRVRLGVTIADSPAMQLYKTSGFEPVGPAEPLRPDSILMSQTMELRLRADQLRWSAHESE